MCWHHLVVEMCNITTIGFYYFTVIWLKDEETSKMIGRIKCHIKGLEYVNVLTFNIFAIISKILGC